MSEGRGVQSIEVGSRLLEALASADSPMMLRDVAKAARVGSAQAHAYLVSFRKQLFVEQDNETGLYRLGPFALQLGLARLRATDPLKIASEAAFDYASVSGFTAAVSVWGAYGPTVVSVSEGVDQVHIATRPGTVYSLTGTATGRVFIALLSERLIAPVLKAQRSEGERQRYVGTHFDLKAIAEHLGFIRANGYGIARSAPVPGINALAAPVYNVNGQIALVMTTIGSTEMLDVGVASPHAQELLHLAASISSRLGFSSQGPVD